MNNKLKIIFAGTPEFASVTLQALIDNSDRLNIDIVAVYTQPDRKAGRGQKLTASPVKKLALEHNITVEQPLTFKKSTDEGMQAREVLQSYHADLMVVVAYGLILPIGVLETPRLGCLNIHGSLLPRWRGAAPIHRAILAGDTITGITIMQMDKGLDTGDMLYKVECPITENDTTASLHDKLATLGAEAIQTVLADVEKYQVNAIKQDDSLATYADKLSKSEGQINWHTVATDIARQIRGMTPYPSSFSFINGQRVKIITARAIDTDKAFDKANGEIIAINKQGITVTCGDNTLLQITSLQFAGQKAITAEQLANSNKLAIGDQFSNSDSEE